MKTLSKVIPVIFVIAILLGCSMGNETATIRVNIGQAGGAKAVSMGDISHVLVFSGPTGSKTVNVPKGGGSVSVSVMPGTWTISVTAYYGDQVYAVGSATAEVKAGQSTSVSVQMTVVWTDSAGVPDMRPQLTAQDIIFGIRDDLLNSQTTTFESSTVSTFVETALPNIHTEDFTWQYYINGIQVTAGVDPMYPWVYEVQAGDAHKKLTVIATHPDYIGSVTLGPVYVCQLVDDNDWDTAIAAKPDGYFFLDAGPYTTIPDPILGSPFTGYFDGNGETIDLNFVPNTPGNYGLFAEIGESGIVKNLKLDVESSYIPIINEAYNFGGVAGINHGTIRNVAVAVVSGGISINASSFPVTGNAGGIAGQNFGNISNCSVQDNQVQATGTYSQMNAGGIAGVNSGQISFCWVEAAVTASGISESNAGGIAGKNTSSIKNCVVLDSGGSINVNCTPTGNAGRIWGNDTGGSGSTNFSNVSVNTYTVMTGTTSNKDGGDASLSDFTDPDWWFEYASGVGWGSVYYDDPESPWIPGIYKPDFWF